ncbi:hypothetical protein C8R43DRAFT_1107618 [Mycena crocata]|nr:hypothetical protein C8R43DRAFT_1107618 [Mycena crocata]
MPPVKRTENFEVIDQSRVERNALMRQMIAKFGQRFLDILRQYGAYECISDDDGNIIDVVAPEEYIAESDLFALDRHLNGSYDSLRFNMSAKALQRLAESERAFYAMQARQLRADPAFLRKQVETAAEHRPELAPDEQGNGRTPAEILTNPRYVAQQTRFIINNTLTAVNHWMVISKYLADVAALDETKGRFGAQRKREELMSCVNCMLRQAIESTERRVRYGIVVNSHLSKFWCRAFDHPDWEGARMVVLKDSDATKDYLPYLKDLSLDGSLVRFASQDFVCSATYTARDLRRNLLKAFFEAPAETIETLDDYLVENLSELNRLEDFLELINHPEEDKTPKDERYTKFARATQLSQKILTKTTLEKFIKTSASLEVPTVFAKIWKEIDGVSMKDAKTKIEQVLGFAPVASRWSTPIALPIEVEQSDETTRAQQVPSLDEPKPEAIPESVEEDAPKPEHRPKIPQVELEPAKIAPYRTQVELPPVVEAGPPRQGPKVKTKGVAADSTSAPVNGAATQQASKPVLPAFTVSKRVYDVFARIFSDEGEKGQLKFTEFRYAMTSIGFSYIPSDGSIVTFGPPAAPITNIPFTCHQPHGGKNTIGPVMIREYRAGLNDIYGWTLKWFGLKSEAGGDD